jgi:hypothetical protein
MNIANSPGLVAIIVASCPEWFGMAINIMWKCGDKITQIVAKE